MADSIRPTGFSDRLSGIWEALKAKDPALVASIIGQPIEDAAQSGFDAIKGGSKDLGDAILAGFSGEKTPEPTTIPKSITSGASAVGNLAAAPAQIATNASAEMGRSGPTGVYNELVGDPAARELRRVMDSRLSAPERVAHGAAGLIPFVGPAMAEGSEYQADGSDPSEQHGRIAVNALANILGARHAGRGLAERYPGRLVEPDAPKVEAPPQDPYTLPHSESRPVSQPVPRLDFNDATPIQADTSVQRKAMLDTISGRMGAEKPNITDIGADPYTEPGLGNWDKETDKEIDARSQVPTSGKFTISDVSNSFGDALGKTVNKDGVPEVSDPIQTLPPLDFSEPAANTRVSGLEVPDPTLPKESSVEDLPDFSKKYDDVDLANAGVIEQKPSANERRLYKENLDNFDAPDEEFVINEGKPRPSHDFKDYVNASKAADVEALGVKQKFSDLDQVKDIIDLYQQDMLPEDIANRIRDYTEGLHKANTDVGIDLGHKENYLQGVWENSPEEIRDMMKRAGIKPSYTMESVYQDYMEGKAAGLTPKYENISDLLAHMELKNKRAIAAKMYHNYLEQNNLLQNANVVDHEGNVIGRAEKPAGFREGNKLSENFKALKDTYIAPQEFEKLSGHFSKPESGIERLGAAAAEVSRSSKNLGLVGGVPGTGLNAHGFNILARTLAYEPGKLARHIKLLVKPSLSIRFKPSSMEAVQAIKDGLTFSQEGFSSSMEGHGFGNVGGFAKVWDNGLTRAVDSVTNTFEEHFAKPLMDEVIPAIKYQYYNKMKMDFINQGIEPDMAGKRAAKMSNDHYSGINQAELGRSANYKNFIQTVFLAPDFLESNYNIAKGSAKALLDRTTPEGKAYFRGIRNLGAAYVAANVINYANTGHTMWDNSPDHQMSIAFGNDEKGKTRYIRPFGTATEFARLPLGIAKSLIEGDPGKAFKVIKNKTAGPLQAVINLAWNTDYAGNPLYNKSRFGKDIPLSDAAYNIGSELIAPVSPNFISEPIKALQGRSSPEEAAAKSLELPIQYTAPKKAKRSKASSELAGF